MLARQVCSTIQNNKRESSEEMVEQIQIPGRFGVSAPATLVEPSCSETHPVVLSTSSRCHARHFTQAQNDEGLPATEQSIVSLSSQNAVMFTILEVLTQRNTR